MELILNFKVTIKILFSLLKRQLMFFFSIYSCSKCFPFFHFLNWIMQYTCEQKISDQSTVAINGDAPRAFISLMIRCNLSAKSTIAVGPREKNSLKARCLTAIGIGRSTRRG